MTEHRCFIRTAELVACQDCRVAFSGNSCPACGATVGIYPVESEAPSREIAKLRELLSLSEAVLVTIARRGGRQRIDGEKNKDLAERMLAKIRDARPAKRQLAAMPVAGVIPS